MGEDESKDLQAVTDNGSETFRADVFSLRESLNCFARIGRAMLNATDSSKETYRTSFKQTTEGHLAEFDTKWGYAPLEDCEFVEFRVVVKKSELEHLESLKETKKNIEEKILLMTGA